MFNTSALHNHDLKQNDEQKNKGCQNQQHQYQNTDKSPTYLFKFVFLHVLPAVFIPPPSSFPESLAASDQRLGHSARLYVGVPIPDVTLRRCCVTAETRVAFRQQRLGIVSHCVSVHGVRGRGVRGHRVRGIDRCSRVTNLDGGWGLCWFRKVTYDGSCRGWRRFLFWEDSVTNGDGFDWALKM